MKTEKFQTGLGTYYLPEDIKTDVIANMMKAGKIFEPEILNIAKRFICKGTAVLDLGANFGQMSLLFSDLVGSTGKVYSFEAADDVCEVLKKNIEANKKTNVIPICKAVYDSVGKLKFYPEPDFSRFGSYGSYGLDPAATAGRTVETITIDSLDIKEFISFMKIDIQGSDLFAMKGARKTIMKNRMPILFEYEEQFQQEFDTSFYDYMEFIDSIQYRVLETVSGINFVIIPKESTIEGITKQSVLFWLRNAVAKKPKSYFVPVFGNVLYNCILDNNAREFYKSVVFQMHGYVPAVMNRKIPRANVQQAFVLNAVYRFTRGRTDKKVFCVGSFEDTACASLKVMGYPIEEIDPSINYDLNTYLHLPTTTPGSFDIIFSTSVLEHVEDDALFISEVASLLKPGGVAIHTCDFNNVYVPGDKLPATNKRFYTEADMYRLSDCAVGCSLVDIPNWYHGIKPDFFNEGCRYTFATITFKKDTVG